jgi:hypothetical protein
MASRSRRVMELEQQLVICHFFGHEYRALTVSSAEYVGDDLYEPIWTELDRRKAIVFLHGSQTPSSTPYPHSFLGIPITEVRSPLTIHILTSMIS